MTDTFTEPVSAFMSGEDVPVAWLVEDMFAEGANGFIAAEPKVGKSWLGLLLALCLALGLPFLGHDVPKPRRVLYVQEEDSRQRVRRRLRQLVAGLRCADPADDMFRLAVRRGFKIDDAGQAARLRQALADFRPDLVIVDVFNEVHQADDKDQEKISAVLRPFTKLSREFNCGFIILHHFRKADPRAGRGRGGQQMRGSSALHGWSENSLYLSHVKPNRFRVEIESKDSADNDDFEVTIEDADDGGVVLRRAELAADGIVETRWTTIEASLGNGRELTAKAAATLLGCNKKTASNQLNAWHAAGKLDRRDSTEGGPKGTHYFRLPQRAQCAA